MDIVERLRTEQPSYVLIGDAKIEIERLREVLKELLNVIPNFPPDGNFLVDMKERYNQALIEARAAFQQKESE